jgi:hypothetical protein
MLRINGRLVQQNLTAANTQGSCPLTVRQHGFWNGGDCAVAIALMIYHTGCTGIVGFDCTSRV